MFTYHRDKAGTFVFAFEQEDLCSGGDILKALCECGTGPPVREHIHCRHFLRLGIQGYENADGRFLVQTVEYPVVFLQQIQMKGDRLKLSGPVLRQTDRRTSQNEVLLIDRNHTDDNISALTADFHFQLCKLFHDLSSRISWCFSLM